MIFSIPLQIVWSILNGLISVLPDSPGLPADVGTYFLSMWAYVWYYDPIFDVGMAAQYIFLSVGFELAVQAWHFIHWVMRKIPMLNVK